MGTTLVGFVDDVEFISDAEIKKFCQEEQNEDNYIKHDFKCRGIIHG